MDYALKFSQTTTPLLQKKKSNFVPSLNSSYSNPVSVVYDKLLSQVSYAEKSNDKDSTVASDSP